MRWMKRIIKCAADAATDEVYMNIGIWVTWLLLGTACVFDLIYKKIPLLLIISGGVVGVIETVIGGEGVRELLYALIPGVLLLITSFFSGEKVGYGDGMLLLALGLLEGARACLGDLLIGLFLVSFFGLILFIFRKKGKGITVPFVPFLLVAHALRTLVGI